MSGSICSRHAQTPLRSVIRVDTMLRPGDHAPAFSVSDHYGDVVSLEKLRGKTVVLWFFPKADTPG